MIVTAIAWTLLLGFAFLVFCAEPAYMGASGVTSIAERGGAANAISWNDWRNATLNFPSC